MASAVVVAAEAPAAGPSKAEADAAVLAQFRRAFTHLEDTRTYSEPRGCWQAAQAVS